MRHYIYPIWGHEPDPVGTGDAKSWFFYYKWPDEGEVFVPQKPPDEEPAEGDRLWFFVDQRLVGSAVLLRKEVINEGLPGAWAELWFDASTKKDLSDRKYCRATPRDFPMGTVFRVTDEEFVEELEGLLAKST